MNNSNNEESMMGRIKTGATKTLCSLLVGAALVGCVGKRNHNPIYFSDSVEPEGWYEVQKNGIEGKINFYKDLGDFETDMKIERKKLEAGKSGERIYLENDDFKYFVDFEDGKMVYGGLETKWDVIEFDFVERYFNNGHWNVPVMDFSDDASPGHNAKAILVREDVGKIEYDSFIGLYENFEELGRKVHDTFDDVR